MIEWIEVPEGTEGSRQKPLKAKKIRTEITRER